MNLSLIYPAMGRRPGKRYVRSWQMEPLPAAHLAGLTPADVDIRFHDDRMESIPYDEPADLVAISVETYTAKRSYQIASEYRRRGVPVVMGGFHATLCTDEVQRYADAVVVGEAERTWPQVLEDFRAGGMKRLYRPEGRPDLAHTRPDRSIFAGKRYMPLSLVEAGRGCVHSCDFCSIQSAFGQGQSHRTVEDVVDEVRRLKDTTRLFFFVDDNVISHLSWARKLFEALIPLNIRWVGQASINMTYDDEVLALMKRSGCLGVLVGFESLDSANLEAMNKGFNAAFGGPAEAAKQLRKHGMILYSTFVFGYDGDTVDSVQRVLEFCIEHQVFIAAFNHCTPFPGTPLYKRLESEGRLLYDRWWLDERYRYGEVPFRTMVPPRVIQAECVRARKRFHGLRSTLKRMRNRANIGSPYMLWTYLFINGLLRIEAGQREGYPLGDQAFEGELVEVG